jgi:hypothetical protein
MTLLTNAYRAAPANVVAPIEYTGLLWLPLWGFGDGEKTEEADQIGRIGQVDRRQETRIYKGDNGPHNQDQNEQSNILLEHPLLSIGR